MCSDVCLEAVVKCRGLYYISYILDRGGKGIKIIQVKQKKLNKQIQEKLGRSDGTLQGWKAPFTLQYACLRERTGLCPEREHRPAGR